MEPKIEIHTDYCLNIEREEIQSILDQVTALISVAALRAASETETPDEAA